MPGRLIDRNTRWKDKWQNADHQEPRPGRAGLISCCYIYFERNGELAPPHHFYSSSDQGDTATKGVDPISLIGMITHVGPPNLIDQGKVLKGSIGGDWIIRSGAPTEDLVTALGQILNRECGIPVKLELDEELEDVLFIRGRFRPAFEHKPDTTIKIYVNTFQSTMGKSETGTYNEFLTSLGQFIKPQRRVISEIENPPQKSMSWHRNDPTRFDDGDVDIVLLHLEEQTGLKLTLESITIRKVIVSKSE